MTEKEVSARAKESGPTRLLFLGNIIHRKGLHTLIEAISLMRSEVKLDVIGGSTAEPKYATAMQKRSQSPDLKSKVTFHGPMEQDGLAAKLKSAHVLVVPSSYEGFGMVYLEGMAFGLPAIGTTAGAASEIITDGKTGFLIEPGDSKTLAERLSRLTNDRELLARMSVNALGRYRQQPTWNETARRIREFLRVVGMSLAVKRSPNQGKIITPPDGSSQ
jgi:glycosyltransferase involved in cell wall biosynthesis